MLFERLVVGVIQSQMRSGKKMPVFLTTDPSFLKVGWLLKHHRPTNQANFS